MILIGLPTNRLIKPKCAESLLNLKGDFKCLVSTKGYNTAENRNYIVTQAVKGDYTHLFLVDDDMIYEPDTLERLLACDKDMVGGLYKTKYEDPDYVIEADKIEDKIFECKAIGGGLLLVKTEVFKKVPQPHFGYKWYPSGMVKESNDWYFCNKAREFGYKVWCEPSITAKHIGLCEY